MLAAAGPRSAACACEPIKEGVAVSQRRLVISLSAARVIHEAVSDTLTADETSEGGADTWPVVLYRVGAMFVFAFLSTATALDD